MIRTVIRCANDMVLVLDRRGKQIPQYQGKYQDVKENILRDAVADTVFYHWSDYAIQPETDAREAW